MEPGEYLDKELLCFCFQILMMSLHKSASCRGTILDCNPRIVLGSAAFFVKEKKRFGLMSRRQVHGLDPIKLLEKIVRDRIRESLYWKEQCFALTAESLLDRAVALEYVGGMFGGNQSASPFVCLLLKLLELQPEEEIILSFIHQKDFKYLRVLAAFYYRMTAASKRIYLSLEPLVQDYQKIRVRIGGSLNFFVLLNFIFIFCS